MKLAVRVMMTLLVVSLALTGQTAAAQAKKKDPKAAPAAKADPKAAAKADPKAAAKKPEERKGPAKLDGKEPVNAADVEKEAFQDKKRDEQIEAAKKIIPKIEDGNPTKADLLFQLSELYWEKSRYLYRKEMLTFFNAQKEADEKKNRGEKAPEPKEEHRESELYRSETMRLYETILREYPTYERKDEVLFNLAYNQYDIGKKDLAIKRYEELLKSYPGSKFVSDTYVQLGNHYFEVANVLDKAKTYYEKAFASSNPRIKSYALYKLAWCDFNAGEHEKALKKLMDTVDFAEKQGKEKYATDLKNEALNDSIRMFVQLNRADDAMAYFKAHAGKKKQNLAHPEARVRPAGSRSPRQRDQVVPLPVERQRGFRDGARLAAGDREVVRRSASARPGEARGEEARRHLPPGLDVVAGQPVEEGSAAQRLQRRRRGDAHDGDRVPPGSAEDEGSEDLPARARHLQGLRRRVRHV
ncbi:MAG: tetratricopeptide repeat protein [Archangium sp.]